MIFTKILMGKTHWKSSSDNDTTVPTNNFSTFFFGGGGGWKTLFWQQYANMVNLDHPDEEYPSTICSANKTGHRQKNAFTQGISEFLLYCKIFVSTFIDWTVNTILFLYRATWGMLTTLMVQFLSHLVETNNTKGSVPAPPGGD